MFHDNSLIILWAVNNTNLKFINVDGNIFGFFYFRNCITSRYSENFLDQITLWNFPNYCVFPTTTAYNHHFYRHFNEKSTIYTDRVFLIKNIQLYKYLQLLDEIDAMNELKMMKTTCWFSTRYFQPMTAKTLTSYKTFRQLNSNLITPNGETPK